MRLITLLRNKVKKVCDIHYEVGAIYNININDIKIPEDFEKTPPRKAKMDRKRKYYKEHGQFDKPIVLKQNLELCDGYVNFLLAKNEFGFRYVECCFVDE